MTADIRAKKEMRGDKATTRDLLREEAMCLSHIGSESLKCMIKTPSALRGGFVFPVNIPDLQVVAELVERLTGSFVLLKILPQAHRFFN